MASPNYSQGYLGTTQAGVEARNDVTVAIRNWFANRNPLVTRLPYVPVERVDFLMYSHAYRSRSTKLSSVLSVTTTTTMLLTDNTFLMNHDVLEIVDSATLATELVQVSADPSTTTTGQVSITRGIASTTPLQTGTSGSTVYLIGNARNGAEVNQTGLTTIGVSRTQYCQTYQFPVQVGGSAQTARAQVFPGGIQSPFDFNMTVQLQNMVDDIENVAYYGKAVAPVDSSSQIAMSNGISNILVTNNVTSPTNAAAYAATDLIRDTLQACRTGGGEPDLLVVSTNFMSGFATWGQAVQRIPAGETVFGTPIKIMKAPFLDDISIIEAPLLQPYTAIALTSGEVYMRNKRNPVWNSRGNRGDMVEGDWIAEMAIEIVNESHHAWVQGITAFAAN